MVNDRYKHGGYTYFEVNDSKRREVAVAPVCDRVVHRLLYEYILPRWDQAFIFDAWSCRKNKGQHLAIARAASFMDRYNNAWLWRADIHKFFDTVDQALLLEFVSRRIKCQKTLGLIREVLISYYKNEPGKGMPIGNLTSQIFANIYLNEFDRHMVHVLKPHAYLRYGDDWLCFSDNLDRLEIIQGESTRYIVDVLQLKLSQKLDFIVPVYKGTTYLGIDLWPNGRRITKKTRGRISYKVKPENYSSYQAFIKQFSSQRHIKQFYWQTLDLD